MFIPSWHPFIFRILWTKKGSRNSECSAKIVAGILTETKLRPHMLVDARVTDAIETPFPQRINMKRPKVDTPTTSFDERSRSPHFFAARKLSAATSTCLHASLLYERSCSCPQCHLRRNHEPPTGVLDPEDHQSSA